MDFMTLQIWPMLLLLPFMFLGMFVSYRLKSKFAKYSKISLSNGLTGKEIAETMLITHDLQDVEVICVAGQLTDHYNPMNRTVNLSKEVYHGANAAAAAVAAHECGHAVQHAEAYGPLTLRSKLVPIQNASGTIIQVVTFAALIGGSFLFKVFPFTEFVLLMIALNAVIFFFALITLPVEFDASKRALAWIKNNGVVTASEYDMSKDALKWAAMTYVVAALSALMSLVYWIAQLLLRRD
jgi:Zn-dependent membrane protease YugP